LQENKQGEESQTVGEDSDNVMGEPVPAKWNTKTTQAQFLSNGGMLLCSKMHHNKFLDASLFDYRNTNTGQCYSTCRDCKQKEHEGIRTDFNLWIRSKACNCNKADRLATDGTVGSAVDSNNVMELKLRRVYKLHDGLCEYCEQDLIFLSDKGDQGAQIEREFPRLRYNDDGQVLKFICGIMCNWAKCQHNRRQFKLILRQIVQSAGVEHRVVPPTPSDVTRIKTMRKDNYAREDRRMGKQAANANYPCELVGKTATPAQFVAVAKRDGKQCRLTGIVGEWNAAPTIFKLGFNRLKNFEGLRHRPFKKYAHSYDNIEVKLTFLNLAQNQFDEDSVIRWIARIRSKASVADLNDNDEEDDGN